MSPVAADIPKRAHSAVNSWREVRNAINVLNQRIDELIPGSAGVTAPDDPAYLLENYSDGAYPLLPNRRRLVAGANIGLSDGGAAGDLTVAATGVATESFRIWTPDSGGDIVADGPADTATLAGGEGISTVGTPASDIITVGMDRDKFPSNLLRFFDGTFLETFDALVTSDGATITLSIEQSGGGDLTEIFSSGETTLDCTPAATIALTPGLDTAGQLNFIYILQSAPGVLVKSTSDWPAEPAEHIRIAVVFVQSASLVNTGAPGNNWVLINQNINDHAAGTDGQGHLSHMGERIRAGGQAGSIWKSGCEGVATQDGNDLWVSIAAGVTRQMHRHTFPVLDSDTAGAGDPIVVINDPDAANALINSLNSITKHSTGVAIGNNKYVKFVVSAVANKTGSVSPILLHLPSDEYNTQGAAERDVDGYANFTIQPEYAVESSTGLLIVAFVCKHTATAMEIVSTQDLRGQAPSTVAGAGTGGGDVTAAANLTDHSLIRGDGGAKGIQDSGILIDDSDVITMPSAVVNPDFNADLLDGNHASAFVGTHAMLDGSVHSDSVADGVTRGSLIYGNATPKWDELPVGGAGEVLTSDGTDIAWAAAGGGGMNDLIDDVTPQLGGNLDTNDKHIQNDGAEAYVTLDDRLYVTQTFAVGASLPLASTGIRGEFSGATVEKAVSGTIANSAVNAGAIALDFTAVATAAAPTLDQSAYGVKVTASNEGIADAGKTMFAYGGHFAALQGVGLQDSATGDIKTYSGYFDSAFADSPVKHTAGNFYTYTLLAEDATPPSSGTPTSNQAWCALFEGDVQINSGKKLILEGSATAKGDTYIVFQNARIEFFLNGTLEGYVNTTGFVSV